MYTVNVRTTNGVDSYTEICTSEQLYEQELLLWKDSNVLSIGIINHGPLPSDAEVLAQLKNVFR